MNIIATFQNLTSVIESINYRDIEEKGNFIESHHYELKTNFIIPVIIKTIHTKRYEPFRKNPIEKLQKEIRLEV